MSIPELSLLSNIVAGMSCGKLRPDDHLTLTRHVVDTLDILGKMFVNGSVVINVGDGEMHFNEIPIPVDEPEGKRLFLQLRRKKT